MLPFLATARQAKRSAFLFSANIQKTVDKHTFFCYNNKAFADMAQQVEHILGKDEVIGSIPIISSSKTRRLICAVCGFSFSYNQKLKHNPRLESGIVHYFFRFP